MSGETLADCLAIIEKGSFKTVDVTGGAPEMNPGYRDFMSSVAGVCSHVMTRTNLAILTEDGYGDLPEFWARLGIEVAASLPFYQEGAADRVRGKGVFNSSIEALRALNEAGYGTRGGHTLNLVYNPSGAVLPQAQSGIETDFRKELEARYGVTFTALFTLANMPLGRFSERLESKGGLARYMKSLADSFNPVAAAGVMCRTTLSVGWDGALYDCDFNQVAGIECGFGAPTNIKELAAASLSTALSKRRVATAPHCFGCTAGAGSSCTGEVA